MSEEVQEEQQAKPVQVILITGYLGAGKTTLLNSILTNNQGIRAAVIVNDIGEVNIDAELIAQMGPVTQMDGSLIPLTNVSICCSLSEDLANQLVQLAYSGNYDYIIIEASGICEPMPIAYTISSFCDVASGKVEFDDEEEELLEDDDELAPIIPMELDNVIAVVDCARMFDEFNGGKDLLEDDAEEDDICSLLIDQIEFCSTLVLNKVDQVTPEQLDELKVMVRSLQKDAVMVEAIRGNVPLNELLDTGRFDFDKVFDSAAWVDAMENGLEEPEHEHHHDHDHDHECDDPECECHHHHHDHDGNCCCGHDHAEGHDHVAEYGITTFIYERRAPFSMDAMRAIVKEWPATIIRCKGMLWMSDDNDTCWVFEQAGQRFYRNDNGPWLATASEEDKKLILEANPHALDDWDEEVGDRRTKLVFIGKNMDQAEIEAWLDSYMGK